MSTVITDAEQLTPTTLTNLLHAHGALPQGSVVAVQKESSSTEQAELLHLTLEYSPRAPADAPRRLFAKLARHNRDYPGYEAISASEALFYALFAPQIGAPPLARCYAVQYDPALRRTHLLLEDLAETHGVPKFPDEWPLPPPYSMYEQIVDALVGCQAPCWDHSRLGELPGGYPAHACPALLIQSGVQNYPRFADAMGDRLSPGTRQIFEQVLAAYPLLNRRMADRKHLTLIHGDFIFGNLLLPHDPQQHTVRIIDWELCRAHIGTFDLAEVFSLHWDAGPRSERERDLVRRYHTGLLAQGVREYSWEQCWYDYRLALIDHLFTPIQQWSDRHWPGFWWGRLERTLKRFVDLECAELLQAYSGVQKD
jgi:hypothetical protein